MKNEICKFTVEESHLLIAKCKKNVSSRFGWLDIDSQYDLALDAYTYLCKYHNHKKSAKPAFRSAVQHAAVDSKIIQGKTKLQKVLEKKVKNKEVLTKKETAELQELKEARIVRTVSLDALVEATGYDEKYGVTDDAETLMLKADGLRRIKRAVAGRPLAEKAVELILEGHEFKDVAKMLGVSYRTLFHNLDGTGNSPLPVDNDNDNEIVIDDALFAPVVAPVAVPVPAPI